MTFGTIHRKDSGHSALNQVQSSGTSQRQSRKCRFWCKRSWHVSIYIYMFPYVWSSRVNMDKPKQATQMPDLCNIKSIWTLVVFRFASGCKSPTVMFSNGSKYVPSCCVVVILNSVFCRLWLWLFLCTISFCFTTFALHDMTEILDESFGTSEDCDPAECYGHFQQNKFRSRADGYFLGPFHLLNLNKVWWTIVRHHLVVNTNCLAK